MGVKLQARIFGLNTTRPCKISAEEMRRRARGDRVARERLAYLENPEPHCLACGPRTRREFLY